MNIKSSNRKPIAVVFGISTLLITFFLIFSNAWHTQAYGNSQATMQITPVITLTPGDPQDIVIDRLNRFIVKLPFGWQKYVPSQDAQVGATVMTNFDSTTYGTFKENRPIPEGYMKVQISTGPMDSEKPFDQWVAERIALETSDEIVLSTQPYPFKLGRHEGMAFILNDQNSVLEIVFPLSSERVVSIGIMPANSQLLSDVLFDLSSIEFFNDQSEIPSLSETVRGALHENFILPDFLAMPQQIPQIIPSSTTGTCNYGTFTFSEAKRATIPLHLPFIAGETWQVGAEGSFYGNGLHCNSNNDYYATDWNMGVGNIDQGKAVLAVADGTVVDLSSPCLAIGYGCYIKITHLQGFQTLYAHLESIYGFNNEKVFGGDQVGRVGCTGSCDEAHLHLTFRHNDNGFYSYCYNNGSTCPNGENPKAPQGYIPSPIMTENLIDDTLNDFVWYTSLNGRVILADLRNDSWVTHYWVQNSSSEYRYVDMYYRYPWGDPTPADVHTCMLNPGQYCWIPVDQYNRIPSNQRGSAFMDGSEEALTVAMQFNNVEINADNAFYLGDRGDPSFERAGKMMYAASVSKYLWGFHSEITIMNPSPYEVNVTVNFKGRQGTSYEDSTWNIGIPPRGQWIADVAPYINQSSWNGSLIVESSSYPVAVKVTNTNTDNGYSFTYNAAASGKTKLFIPEVTNNWYSVTTGLIIQNATTYSGSNVKVKFYNRDGSYITEKDLGHLDAGRANGFMVSSVAGIPSTWAGTAVVESTGTTAVAVVRGDRPSIGGYYGYSAASTPSSWVQFPIMFKNISTGFGTINSSILIQNKSTSRVTIYLSFTNSGGVYREADIEPLGAYALYIGSMSDLGSSWAGSILVQTYPESISIVGMARHSMLNGLSAYNGLIELK